MLMLALRLILMDKSGKQHYLPFVGSKRGLRYFWKRGNIRKGCVSIEAPLYSLYWGFKKTICKACLLFNCFLVIFWKLYFLSLLDYWNSLICLAMAQIWGKDTTKAIVKLSREDHPPYCPYTVPAPPFNSLLDSLRWAPFSLALHLYFS